MSAIVDIRPVTAADFDQWLPLWQGYQAFYKTTIAAEVTAVTWARFLNHQEPMGAALAWEQGQAVGLVHHILHRSCWTVGNYCYLQDLFVAPTARGKHYGRALIEYVYAYAAKEHCNRVHWLTHESNTHAMQLYDRLAQKPGFIQYRHLLP